MNVLVTGAGLLGVHVARCLADHGAEVTMVDVHTSEPYCRSILGDRPNGVVIRAGSILDGPFIESLMVERNIGCVVHTAAVYDRQEHYCDNILEVNLIGTELLLKKSVQHGARRFVFISTVSAYNFRTRPSGEVDEDYSTSPSGRCIYGATKALGEALGNYFAAKQQLDFVSVRFCDLYGPNRSTEPRQKAIWQQLFDRAIVDGIVNLDEPQLHRNQYLFVRDAAVGIEQILRATRLTHATYNLASKELYGMEDFVEIAQRNVSDLRVIGSMISSAGYQYGVSCRRAVEDFGFNPATSLEEGFRVYRDFMAATSDRAR